MIAAKPFHGRFRDRIRLRRIHRLNQNLEFLTRAPPPRRSARDPNKHHFDAIDQLANLFLARLQPRLQATRFVTERHQFALEPLAIGSESRYFLFETSRCGVSSFSSIFRLRQDRTEGPLGFYERKMKRVDLLGRNLLSRRSKTQPFERHLGPIKNIFAHCQFGSRHTMVAKFIRQECIGFRG